MHPEQAIATASEAECRTVALELHDLLLHRVSSLAIQAAAAARLLRLREPDRADGFGLIADSAREALLELRGLGIVLGARSLALRSPQPDLTSFPSLAGDWVERGVPVELRMRDIPSSVPAAIALMAVRVAEAALHEVERHGTPEGAQIELRGVGRRLVLEVRNATATAPRRVTEGRGLTRMRQRVEAVGGELETLSVPSRRWTVRATFRLEGPS